MMFYIIKHLLHKCSGNMTIILPEKLNFPRAIPSGNIIFLGEINYYISLIIKQQMYRVERILISVTLHAKLSSFCYLFSNNPVDYLISVILSTFLLILQTF